MGKLPTCDVKFACTGDVVDVRATHGLWPLAGCTKRVPSLTVPRVSKGPKRMVTQKVFSGNPFSKKLKIEIPKSRSESFPREGRKVSQEKVGKLPLAPGS